MSESTDKAATEVKAEKKKNAHPAKKKHARKSQPWFIPLIILLLIVIGGGYTGWQQYRKQNNNTSDNLSQLQEQVDKLSRALKYQSDDQQTQLDELTTKHNDLKRSFAAMLKSSGHLKNDWLLAEAEYLVKLANHRLILEKDITTAIAAMEEADERIREIADPALLEVRKILLKQTQQLRIIEQPDLTGMALQISALKTQIPQLAMKTPDPATVQQRKKQPSKASRVESWSELPAAMWEDLKSLITIRDHAQVVQPLIPPDQQYFLTQNLNLQLEQARLALLKGNNSLYADSMNTAIQWLEKHFDTGQQNTQSIIAGLRELITKNIEPTIPDISQSYKVLQQYRVNGFVPKQDKKTKAEKQPEPAKKEPVKEPAEQPESSVPEATESEAPKKIKL